MSKTEMTKVHSTSVTIDYVGEWCEATGWHGIVNVHNAKKRSSKIAWLLIVLTGGFMACWQSAFLITDFVSNSNWVSSVSYEMPDDDGRLEWPNITVCNLNFMFNSQLEADKLSGDVQIAFAALLRRDAASFYSSFKDKDKDNNKNETNINETILDTLTQYAKTAEIFANMSITEMLRRYSTKCNDTVVHCGFSSSFVLDDHFFNICCDSLQKLRFRNCFSMHPTNVFGKVKARLGSEDVGVYYLFDPQVEDYYDQLMMKDKPSAGLRLQLYYGTLEGSTAPETLLLSPGTHALVSLVPEKRRTVYEQAPIIPFYPGRKDCIDSYTYRYIDSGTYSQSLCTVDCWVEWNVRECNCTVATVRLKENRECVGEKIPACFQIEQDFRKRNTTYEDGFNVFTCQASCGEACEYSDVQTKISQALFPAQPKVKAFTTELNRVFYTLGYNYTEEDARQLILFEMFYETVEYKVITKMEKTTIGQFISSVGGTLGLWTGISLLSIIEAMIFICACLRQTLTKMWREHTKIPIAPGKV